MRWMGLAVLLLLAATAVAEETPEAERVPGPFLGIEGLDVTDPAHRDPARLALLRGAGPLLGRTRPVAWGTLEPHAPVMGGRHLRAWDALDPALAAWSEAGVHVVLVLDPRSPWASQPAEESSWRSSVRASLPEADADALVAGARGASPPGDDAWDHWELLLKDLVERYDGDGEGDADKAQLRWIQVVERPASSEYWIGNASEYGRLLHLASQGAQRASYSVGIVHGIIDFRTLGHPPWPDDLELIRRLQRISREWPPALVLEARRVLDFTTLTLSLGDLFGAVLQAGSGHLTDERVDVGWIRHMLDGQSSKAAEVWLGDTRAQRHAEPDLIGARGPDAEALRLRSRWLGTAKRRHDEQYGLAQDWLERGRAHDVVRSLGTACAAGATRVFVGGNGKGEGIDVFVAPREKGGWRRTPAWYALRQANRLLAPHTGAVESRLGRDCSSYRFEMASDAELPWVLLVAVDADLSWAGDPRLGPVIRAVAVPLPDGRYVVEQTTLADGHPRQRRVDVQGGGLQLELDSAPVWIYPDV